MSMANLIFPGDADELKLQETCSTKGVQCNHLIHLREQEKSHFGHFSSITAAYNIHFFNHPFYSTV